MKPFRWIALTAFLLAIVFTAPAWAFEEAPPPSANNAPLPSASFRAAAPGTINYVEGEATLGTEPLTKESIGTAVLQPGDVLTTSAGKVEILLGPGMFLRVGDNSMARIVAQNPPQVELTQGEATVEVLPHHPEVLLVNETGSSTRLVKNGLYEFNADRGQIYVYKGEAQVQAAGHNVKVKGGHVLDLNRPNLKTAKFDKKTFENSDLVQWSGLRSEYLAEANADAARQYYANTYGWHGPGWYWDPAFYAYTWVPADDYFYDPFGWGFFSPAWVVEDPFLFVGFFGDFGFESFGHHHFGRHRLPESFEARAFRREGAHSGFRPGTAPAIAGRAGATAPSAFSHPAFSHGGFNRGTVTSGGIRGGFGGMRGGGMHGSIGGTHAGGGFGGGHGGGGHAGGFGGGFGGGHR